MISDETAKSIILLILETSNSTTSITHLFEYITAFLRYNQIKIFVENTIVSIIDNSKNKIKIEKFMRIFSKK
jgi:hypothetical protein